MSFGVDRKPKTGVVRDVRLSGTKANRHAEFFGDHKPARAVVPTRELHFGFLVEIDCLAAVLD